MTDRKILNMGTSKKKKKRSRGGSYLTKFVVECKSNTSPKCQKQVTISTTSPDIYTDEVLSKYSCIFCSNYDKKQKRS